MADVVSFLKSKSSYTLITMQPPGPPGPPRNEAQLSVSDNNTIYWKQKSTKSGASYRIGFEQPENIHTTDKKRFDITVNWPVGDSSWKKTDKEVQEKAGIWRYALYRVKGPFPYELAFSNTEDYDYYFYDEAGDNYNNNTWLRQDHWIDFESNEPTIKRITGS